MSEPQIATIRRLPDGEKQPARFAGQSPGRVTVIPLDHESNALKPAALVEIEDPRGFYLGEIVAAGAEGALTIAVEHFIDRAALTEVERAWKNPSHVA
jgi:hypothetical protein